MSNGQTYEVICRQGRIRTECPLRLQGNTYCVECGYAGYILRAPVNKEAVENPTENKEESIDNNES